MSTSADQPHPSEEATERLLAAAGRRVADQPPTIVPPLHTIRADAKRLQGRRLMTGAAAAVALIGITGGAVAALSGAGQPAQLVSATSGSGDEAPDDADAPHADRDRSADRPGVEDDADQDQAPDATAEPDTAGGAEVEHGADDGDVGGHADHSALCTIAPDGDLTFGAGMPFDPDVMDDDFDVDRSGFASGHGPDGLDGAVSLTVTKVAGGTAAGLGIEAEAEADEELVVDGLTVWVRNGSPVTVSSMVAEDLFVEVTGTGDVDQLISMLDDLGEDDFIDRADLRPGLPAGLCSPEELERLFDQLGDRFDHDFDPTGDADFDEMLEEHRRRMADAEAEIEERRREIEERRREIEERRREIEERTAELRGDDPLDDFDFDSDFDFDFDFDSESGFGS